MARTRIASTLFARLAMCLITAACVAVWWPSKAVADIYDAGAGPLGVLNLSTGTLNIDTGTTPPTMSGAFTANGDVDDGVAVFRFQDVFIGPGVTVNLTGSRPLAITSAGDIVIGANLNASGAGGARLGGGAGGAGGAGATVGGTGGAGGAGGAGGGAVPGGRGGLNSGNPSFDGEIGASRSNGTTGSQGASGADGSIGATGGAGSPGTGTTGGFSGTPGAGGGGGSAGIYPGDTFNGGGGATPGGGGGGGAPGTVNANAGNGNTGSDGVIGGNGTVGTAGANGGNGQNGLDATFTTPANTFALVGGAGGGGGGGGGKGSGGQGGGGGGGGSSGGGGGGGGAVDAQHNCGSSTDGVGGNGGSGGAGGTGGAGGAGGSAPNGQPGTDGGNGGGAVLLSARGIVGLTNGMVINVSASLPTGALPGLPGNAGAAGNSGLNGASGGGGTGGTTASWQFLQGIYCTGNGSATAGSGGTGGQGGQGGTGGAGASSGSSGGGGTGGRGTPGMVKLHGTLILANGVAGYNGNIQASNGASAAPQHSGKVTYISNVNPALLTTVKPTPTGSPVEASLTNDPLLTGATPFDSLPNHPYIGELQGAAGTSGVLKSSFYNSGTAPAVGPQKLDFWRVAPGSTDNLFVGWDQVFLRNNTTETLTGVFLNVAGNGNVLIPTSPPGTLGPNQIFTTTVATGASVVYDIPLTFTGPSNVTVNIGNPATFSITNPVGDGTITYQWQEDITGTGSSFVDMPGETNATLTLAPLYDGSVTPPIFGVNMSYNGRKYRCIVKDNTSTVVSPAATLTVLNVANIVRHPTGGQFYVGDNVTLSVYVTGGTGNYQYVWQRNSVPAPGSPNAPVYTINSISLAQAGNYTVTFVEIGGAHAFGTSNPAFVDVQPHVSAGLPSGGGHDNTGNVHHFTANATGGYAPLSYQWQADYGSGFVNLVDGGSISGATTATLTINPLALSDAGAYRYIVNDSLSSSDTSPSVVLTVTDLLTCNPTNLVSSPRGNAFLYVGEGLTLDMSATGGLTPYTYTWKRNGTPIGAPNSNTFVLTNAQLSDSGNYSCTVSDSSPDPDCTSAPLLVTVVNNLGIASHPANVTKNVTEIATFSVVPSGGIPPLSYQWQFDGGSGFVNLTDGGAISGATTPTLSVGPLLLTHAGQYRCVVTDSGTPQTVTSASATLIVTNNIACNLGVSAMNVYVGETPVFSAVVGGGNGNFSYLWERDTGSGFVTLSDGGNISGATTSTLTISPAGLTDAGVYRLTVTDDSAINAPGSCSLTLGVYNTPTVVVAPTVVNAYDNDPVTYTATVTGGIPPFSYDWRKGGTSLGAPDQNTLSFTATLADDGTTYDVVVTDAGSDLSGSTTVTSNTATLNVRPPIQVLGPTPNNIRAYKDDPPFALGVTASGGYTPLSYNWYLQYPPLPPINLAPFGGTNPILGINPALPAVPTGAGILFCRVTDANSTMVQSANANIQIENHLAITPPGIEDSVATRNGTFTFSITTTGGLGTISYQWFKDDGTKVFQPISGETNPSLTFSPVVDGDAGLYQVEASDQGSTVSSNNDVVTDSATLTVVAGVPVVGAIGLSVLAAITALGGALALRRRPV